MENEILNKIQIEAITDPIMRYIKCMQTFKTLYDRQMENLNPLYMYHSRIEVKERDRSALFLELSNLKEVLEGLGNSVVYNSIMEEERLRYLANCFGMYVNMEAVEKLRFTCDPGVCAVKLSERDASTALSDNSIYERSNNFHFENVMLIVKCANIMNEVCAGITARFTKLSESTYCLFNTKRRKGIMEIAAKDEKSGLVKIDYVTGKYVWQGNNKRALTFLMGNLFCVDHIVKDCIMFGEMFPLGKNEEFRKYWETNYDFSANRRQMKSSSSTRDPEFSIVNGWITEYDKSH